MLASVAGGAHSTNNAPWKILCEGHQGQTRNRNKGLRCTLHEGSPTCGLALPVQVCVDSVAPRVDIVAPHALVLGLTLR